MKAKVAIQYALFFGLAIGLLWWSVKDIDISSLWITIVNANFKPLLIIVIAGFASHFFRALRWQILIEPLGKKVRVVNSFLAIMIGYIVNLATPRMGEVARCAILSKYEDISADKLAGTMIAERVFDLICLLILTATTYYLESDKINLVLSQIQTIISFQKIIIIFIVLVMFMVFIFIFLKLNAKNKESKLMQLVENLWHGIISVRFLKNKLLFFVYTFSIWFCYWFMTWWGFRSIPELSHLSPTVGMTVLTLGSYAMILTPGGTGSFQKLIGNILLPIAFGISIEKATAYSFLSWGVQTLILVSGGFISMILLPILNRKDKILNKK